MAESAAFKSTSRRPTNSQNAPAPPPRRSRSVSAAPRSSTSSSDFLFKVENPLYWGGGGGGGSTSPPPEGGGVGPSPPGSNPKSKSTPLEQGSRGRPVSRSDRVGKEPVPARRSVSRAPPEPGRRGRSVSRDPAPRGTRSNYTSESEVEQEVRKGGSLVGKLNGRNGTGSGGMPVTAGRKVDSLRPSSDGSSSNLPSSPRRSWDDEVVGGGSFSEAEERTIKAVREQLRSCKADGLGIDPSSQIYETVRSEVRRAIADIQNDLGSAVPRGNATAIATASVTDIPPDLVNPGAIELVSDIRREYAIKLEQSQERARKLREDLAIEEHRGLELSKILKEILPDPKTSNGHKSRPGRKSSIERRRMSKRLTEEAMAYFDECVSLSTFDSSDFSSPEDPLGNSFGANPVPEITYFPQTNRFSHLNDKPESNGMSGLEISPLAQSMTKEQSPVEVDLSRPELQWSHCPSFSFGSKLNDTFELQQEISNYVKSYEKEVAIGNASLQARHLDQYDIEEHNIRAAAPNLLFDRVHFKNPFEAGRMLICGGGFEMPFSPFASMI